ncbi:MAG TPA: DUF2723 domain-containing protein [Acidobacteriota bacterium]|nr:DUF2723 domain-containing protein [Acidobacteriota bacterium]
MTRLAHGAAWVAALVSLWVYAVTLSPTVAWVNQGEDSGDLLAASATLGIPHPTGYPLFVLLGRLASLVPLGSVAFRINLVAALAGAAGVYFLVRFVCELASRGGAAASRPAVPAAVLAAVAASLLYAFSRGAWSQSVVAEVYTLNVALFGAILWSCARSERDRDYRFLALAAFLLGLGLANHLLILAAAPAVAWSAWRSLAARKIGMAGLVLLPLLSIWGATLILYLPVRASLPWPAGGPEFSWGVPSTPERLGWVVTGAQYTRNFFTRGAAEVWTHLVPGRWILDFGFGLLVIAAGAAAAARSRFRGHGPALAALAGALALLSLYAIADDVGYWMPVAWLACAIAGTGAAALVSGGDAPPAPAAARAGAAIAGLLLVAAAQSVWGHARSVDASKDLTPYLYAHRNLAAVEPDALIVSEFDGRTFSLWFYKATDFRESHPRLVVAYKYLLVWPWYAHHLARTYAGLRVPRPSSNLDETMNVLIARNLDHRPVYLTRLDPGLAPRFRAEPVGYPPIPLYRVRRADP